MPQKLFDLKAFAEAAGVEYSTMRKYHQRATQRRREHAKDKTIAVADWMLPEPDAIVGQSPVWFEKTVQGWVKGRPRAGAAAAPAEG